MDYSIHLPSAGLNRFRFDGSAFASQPFKAPRGEAEHKADRALRKPKSLEQAPRRRYAAGKPAVTPQTSPRSHRSQESAP